MKTNGEEPQGILLDRREFMVEAAAALALLCSAGACARLQTNPAPQENGQYVFYFTAYPQLRKPGGMTVAGPVKIGRYKGNIYVKRLSDDTVLVLGARCRHLGCDVDWDPEFKMFVCPCHNSHYGPGGELKKGPAKHPLFAWNGAIAPDRITISPQAQLIQS